MIELLILKDVVNQCVIISNIKNNDGIHIIKDIENQ